MPSPPRVGSAVRRGCRPGCRPRRSLARPSAPDPLQSSQGCSTTRPSPPHCGHACVRTNSPNTLRETCCSRPVPLQVVADACSRARLGAVASAARARDGDVERDVAARPRRCLDELDLDLRRDVARRGPGAAPAGAEEVVAEERREEIGQAAEVELRRAEAAAPQPRVAVAVVELARLGASRAPRRPRRPRGSAPPRPAPRRRRGAARARLRRNARLISASSASRETPSSS